MDLINVLKSEIVYGTAAPAIDPMYIAFGVDSNYTRQMGVAMTSILEHNDGVEFHVFADFAPTDELAGRVDRTMNKHGARCVWHIIDPAGLRHLPTFADWSLAIYFRFIAAAYFYKRASRFLYLDGDIVCLGDLRDLYIMPWEDGNTIAAVQVLKTTMSRFGHPESPYFNSGVLVIDPAAWYEMRILDRAITALATNPKRYEWPDQDALNELYYGHVQWLPKKYNQPNDVIGAFPKETVLVHLIHAGAKPWQPWYVSRADNIYKITYERSEWADLSMLVPVRTARECRFMARACLRRHQYAKAAMWYMKYLRWKLFGVKAL